MDDKNSNNKNPRIKLEAKYRTGTHINEQEDKEEEFEIKTFNLEHFIKKNTIRLVLSMIIFALLFSISSLPFSTAQKITQGVKWALTYQMDLGEESNNRTNIIPAISNQIKKITGENDIIAKVNNTPEYITPVEGVVTSPFEDILHPVFNTKIEARGIEIGAQSESDIQSIEKGKVVSIGSSTHGGQKIIIEHDDNTKSIYEGCYETTIGENTKVEKGTVLGKTKSVKDGELSYLYFELWKSESAVNPLDYIDLKLDPLS